MPSIDAWLGKDNFYQKFNCRAAHAFDSNFFQGSLLERYSI